MVGIDCSKCPEGAGCCGCIPIKKELFIKHIDKVQREIVEMIPIGRDEVFPRTEDFKCVFLTNENKCAIYEDRPNVCRDFGTNPGNNPALMCPYFKPTGGKRRPAETKKLRKMVEYMINKRGVIDGS